MIVVIKYFHADLGVSEEVMDTTNLLEDINTAIEEEYGNSIDMDTPIVQSGIDSFGTTMVLLDISQKYGIWNSDEFGDINFAEITPKDIEDAIKNKNNAGV